MRFRGPFKPSAMMPTGIMLLVDLAGESVGYEYSYGLRHKGHLEDFLWWWDEQKGEIEFRARYHGARGEPGY